MVGQEINDKHCSKNNDAARRSKHENSTAVPYYKPVLAPYSLLGCTGKSRRDDKENNTFLDKVTRRLNLSNHQYTLGQI